VCYALRLQGVKAKLTAIYCAVLAAGLRQHAVKKQLTHIHGHSCANVAHILAMASLKGGPSYSLTLHGSLETYGDNHQSKFALARFVSTVTRPLQRDVMTLMQWREDKVPVISMGVDTSQFQGLPRVQNDNQPVRFISVARLALGKGHKFTLEALAECKKLGYSWRYVIVGSGPDEQAIKQTVQDLELQDWVEFKGSMGEGGVIEALELADILMLTSRGTFEAAPVCVMEAMASAIPTITSIIGGTADMITNAEDGFLVPQGDVLAITQAMTAFFEQREWIIQMGEQARKRALIQFDYIALAEKLLRAMKA
jgi:glycosyltransferase involved in cell wall biosynthesis